MIADSIRQAIKAIEDSRSLVDRMRARQPQVIWSLESYYSETHAALVALRAELATVAQEKLPQAEGADWFVVLCPRDGVVLCYDADLGRAFGHEHIKASMEDDLEEFAKDWVVRPAFAQAQDVSRFFDEWEQVLPADARDALRLIAKKGGEA